jgi:hypothetical protein
MKPLRQGCISASYSAQDDDGHTRTSAPSTLNRTASSTGGSTFRETHKSTKHAYFANP